MYTRNKEKKIDYVIQSYTIVKTLLSWNL